MHTRPITRDRWKRGRTICDILGEGLFYTLIRWTENLLEEVRGTALKDTQYQARIAPLSSSSDASGHIQITPASNERCFNHGIDQRDKEKTLGRLKIRRGIGLGFPLFKLKQSLTASRRTE